MRSALVCKPHRLANCTTVQACILLLSQHGQLQAEKSCCHIVSCTHAQISKMHIVMIIDRDSMGMSSLWADTTKQPSYTCMTSSGALQSQPALSQDMLPANRMVDAAMRTSRARLLDTLGA